MRKRPIDTSCALSITDFCHVEGISTYTYKELRKRGLAPRETRIPGSQVVRISPEDRRGWHARLEQPDSQDQIKRDRERRHVIAKNAGKVAIKSPKHPRTGNKQAAEPPPAPRGRGRPRKHPQPQVPAE